jgi:hypothetical protein
MKASLIGSSLRMVLKALVAGLAGIPTMLLSAAPIPMIPVSAGATGVQIQKALDSLPMGGGEVVLPDGIFKITRPIVLQRDGEQLRGAGPTTILRLADNANCPVIIMGEPVNDPVRIVKNLQVSHLLVDGNRSNQQREIWRLSGEGSEIRNNGVTVQGISDSVIEDVTCARCRSGGLVTTRNVRHLTVRGLTSFDNEFDGLACYQTEDSLFTDLDLHDNPCAGISLDLDFDRNIITNAVLTANDLGIFMRSSCGNEFGGISIRNSHHFGVFMAQAEEMTDDGWAPAPETECADNSFDNLIADNCGSAAFRINNLACTNNVIIHSNFNGNLHGGLSRVQPAVIAAR